MKPANIATFLLTVLLMVLTSTTLHAHQTLETDRISEPTRFTETAPPTGPVRPIAEFEPASHVLIRYPLGIPVSLVTHLSNTAHVVCLVSSASVQSQATTAFNNAGVNMSNLSFMTAATDSYWTRDYGPWFVFDGNNNYGVVDFQYNRPRPNDNMIPQLFAQQYGMNYYGMNVQQTGGNYMTDGINTAAQTTIAYTENTSLGPTGVNNKMQQYLGITNYMVLEDPNNTYIDHIDCWSKFLTPDKIMIRSVPTTHAQYNAIEQVASYFANANCAWGYPYKVFRVYTPQNQPYTNSLILNKKVFVPIMNSTHDAAALQSYRNALPGYEVIGITGTSSAPWESTDALHCRTHEIPDRNMLHIKHTPFWGVHPNGSIFDFNAQITAHSNQPVYGDSLFVSYRVNSGSWQRQTLTNISGTNYTAMLTSFSPGDTVRYFIHAADQSGRSADHPVTAALDPHMFMIAPDTIAPNIAHTAPIDVIYDFDTPLNFVASVTDNGVVSQVFFRYKTDSIPELMVPMTHESGDLWTFMYYPEANPGDSNLYYQIIAYDDSNPANSGSFPGANEWASIEFGIVSVEDHIAPGINNAQISVYPNPFNQSSGSAINVSFKMPYTNRGMLTIFNIKGQKVHSQSLHIRKDQHDVYTWDGKNYAGKDVSPGIYIVKLSTNGMSMHNKVLITK